MNHLNIRRGTTPTVSFRVLTDLTVMDDVRLIFSQAGRLLVKTGGDLLLELEDDQITVVSATLSRRETLSWEEGRDVEVQCAYKLGSSANASGIGVLKVMGILEEGTR